MYSIYVDEECIYNDQYPLEAYKVVSPNLKMADSAAGSLDMTLPPVNVGYDKLKRMKSTITVRRWDKEIWEGRLVEDSYDFWHNRKVYIEGALAYFNDTCQPQREYTNVTLDQFIRSVIDIHNSKVPNNRKIYFDYQSVDGSIIEYRATQYQKTLEVLNQVCTDYSCHMKLEKKTVNGVYGNYIKFFTGAITSSTQSVEFGKNLLDYTSNYNMSELATVVVPLGAVKTRSDTNQIGDAIDLTQLKAYNDDDGWGVITAKTEQTVLATEEEVKNHTNELIHHYDGWYGYYTAVLEVKASTETEKNVVYLSSRMHGGFGMYFWQTPDGTSFHSGEWSQIPIGFTDAIEKSIEVPVATDQMAQKKYRLYVGSFGGDIEFRVNVKAKVSEQLDEYYTAEDAMVSSVSLVTDLPTFTQGNIHTHNEENPGTEYDDGTKHIRSGVIYAGAGSRPFEAGLYSIKAAVASGKVVQVRVYWYAGQSGGLVNNTDWETLPARFTLPANDVGYRIRVVYRYPNSTADFPATGEITQMDIYKGERYGSLYVTASSKNLFVDTIEQGNIIESGNNTGLSDSGTNMKRLRTTAPMGVVKEGGVVDGFDSGDYLIHAKTTKTSADDNRTLSIKPFFYDMDDQYASQGEWLVMNDTSGVTITVPDRGSDYSDENFLSATPIFVSHSTTDVKTAMKIDYNAFKAGGSYKVEGSADAPIDIMATWYPKIGTEEHPADVAIGGSSWSSSPHEFTLPDTVSDYIVEFYIRHTDGSEISPTAITSLKCYKSEPLKSKIRFMFKDSTDPDNDSDIAVTALSEIMLEQGVTLPSMYEPANSALQEYGWIETVINFDDCESPDELYYKAKTYLASGQFDKMTLTVKALDLSILGVDTDALEINSYILVNSRPHGLSRFFEISELDIPLDRPDDQTFNLGAETQQTLTSINNNTNSDLLAKINAQTSQSYILDEARKNAEAAILDGFTSGSVVTVTNAAGQPTGLGFFKVWHAADQTHDGDWYTPYTGPYPSSVWDEIVADPAMKNIRCVLINSEGMVFYDKGVGYNSSIALATGTGQVIAKTGLFETMYADRILGGTLTLGIGGSVADEQPDGQLIIKSPDILPWGTESDHGNIVEMNKDAGIVQQGKHEDNWVRQVKILNGRLEGSVYEGGNWHTGGWLYTGDAYGDIEHQPRTYGMRLVTDGGPLILAGSPVIIDGTICTGTYASNDAGITQSATFGTTTLNFKNGLLIGITQNE